MQGRRDFIEAVDSQSSMKILKRKFKMTKEQVEWNIRYLPYHRAYVKAKDAMTAIAADDTLSAEEKHDKIALARKVFREERNG